MPASAKNSSAKSKGVSDAEKFALLPYRLREERLNELTAEQRLKLLYEWEFWARPNQIIPGGDWTTWLIMAGRGYGKTRVGAETCRIWARTNRFVNIIAPTTDDVRDVCIEGESGILACCPPDERPIYRPSKRLLLWPNGCRSLLFTADEPERLRGKQHMKLWADELAAWRFAEAWDQAQLGLRLGSSPQAVVTTTPKPIPIVKALVKDPGTHLTRGSTYENRSNLAAQFYSRIITKYEGTRLGRQELMAELLEDRPGALWTHKLIDDHRVQSMPALRRIGVALDPAITSGERSDEWGIVGAGMDDRNPPHFYVFGDWSDILTPNQAGRKAIEIYKEWEMDYIVAEVNQGGDMVESILRLLGFRYKYKGVHASRGKFTRAEPISSLYEQGRVHHVGTFATLEDEMCDYDPDVTTVSPNRMDALVWIITKLSAGFDARGVHGALELLAQEEQDKKEGKMPAPKVESKRKQLQKPAMSALEKPAVVDQTPRCPFCQSASVAKLQTGQERCGQCGKQWGETRTAFQTPKRSPLKK
jgi:phage terminase large subunit-like protein